MLSRILSCSGCGWRTVCGPADIAARLRLVGQLRRDGEPDEAILAELLTDAAARMTCPGCKRIGLVVGDADRAEDGDDWQTAVLCDRCRQPIDPERLEIFPESRRCVACQSRAEAGEPEPDEPDFCPRCGSLVELRVSRGGGLTRYKRFCTGVPSCRL
ncbi:Prokaryotic dksA/traR C4-type zinc finger [Botrimarina colliarenosi]|uniref:Prokaryotic dksA/traR C4-type zinc finger n=1 Tax=Botrimarina colliarenosi TaxID=2528001 RepID=A0A5C6A931_9BACT|nr:TraR/DksA C4-type zinc finger protein [Botrimarina colliarenosi]TWT95857.1 Prokaryotic dksA/traR C4-type zinc finger [Botrimarina colliarenosi]